MTDAARKMKDRLRADLTLAMRDRRGGDVKTLRALIAAIDNSEAPPLADQGIAREGRQSPIEIQRLLLDYPTVKTILLREIAEREDAAEQMERIGQVDRAKMLKAEAGLVSRYLDLIEP